MLAGPQSPPSGPDAGVPPPLAAGSAAASPKANQLDEARLALRDEADPREEKRGARLSNTPQICFIIEHRLGGPGGPGTGIVKMPRSLFLWFTNPVSQDRWKTQPTGEPPPDWFARLCGNTQGKGGAHETATKALFAMGKHYNANFTGGAVGMYSCEDKAFFPPVQTAKGFLVANGVTEADAMELLTDHSGAAVKPTRGKRPKQPSLAERKKRADRTPVGALRAVPFKEQLPRDQAIEAFLGATGHGSAANQADAAPAPAPAFTRYVSEALSRTAAGDGDLTAEQQQRQDDALKAAREDEEDAAAELEVAAIKQRAAAKRQRAALMTAAMTSPPSTPTDRRPDHETSGLEVDATLRRSASLQRVITTPPVTVVPVVLAFENKGEGWVSNNPERAMRTLFSAPLERVQFLVPTIIGGCTRKVDVYNDSLFVEFYLAPNSVKAWTDVFGGGPSSPNAFFVDNLKVQLLVLNAHVPTNL